MEAQLAAHIVRSKPVMNPIQIQRMWVIAGTTVASPVLQPEQRAHHCSDTPQLAGQQQLLLLPRI